MSTELKPIIQQLPNLGFFFDGLEGTDREVTRKAMCRIKKAVEEFEQSYEASTTNTALVKSREKLVTRLWKHFQKMYNFPILDDWVVVQEMEKDIVQQHSCKVNMQDLDWHYDPSLSSRKIAFQYDPVSGLRYACVVRSLQSDGMLSLQRQMADLSTKIFVSYVYGATGSAYDIQAAYLSSFYDIAQKMLIEYCNAVGLTYNDDLVLIYKGGNLFKLYFEEYYASQLFPESYRPSDIDFEVVVYPQSNTQDDPMFSKHVPNIEKVLVAALEQFRAFLMLNRKTLLDDVDKKFEGRVQDYVAAVPSDAPLEFKNVVPSIRIVPRQDMFITTKAYNFFAPQINCTDPNNAILLPSDRLLKSSRVQMDTSPMYITLNNSIIFQKTAGGTLAHFDLVRMKFHVALSFAGICMNAPSEVIDVSISLWDDEKAIKKRQSKKWTTFTTKGIDNQNVKIVIPTLADLVTEDLGYILFIEAKPWEDMKYKKRLQRFLLGAVMLRQAHVLCHGSTNSSSEVNAYISQYINLLQTNNVTAKTLKIDPTDCIAFAASITPDGEQDKWQQYRQDAVSILKDIQTYIVNSGKALHDMANQCRRQWGVSG
jgi:hypothetical protein